MEISVSFRNLQPSTFANFLISKFSNFPLLCGSHLWQS
uniref:Uncharacterized protein n=1 Tax=Siphoviridae sp. ctYaH2 TaxID=2825549 RepID=A0A8S5V5K6_9CAUD|nr:MAG TPA: hypothetical protein [Siphoviridae sp. ctYaH2]